MLRCILITLLPLVAAQIDPCVEATLKSIHLPLSRNFPTQQQWYLMCKNPRCQALFADISTIQFPDCPYFGAKTFQSYFKYICADIVEKAMIITCVL
ncbi:hypothetical protein THRCLA_20853 [Thraustotheca clavata]|uniref:Elicitin n=1 Tax=Thraustotheca clavata TaxID=74557 RepID=A0A1W0A2T2_9STRA|nr:hypothetical protein THRCLA_20853 [Thraustotheca clavata]